MTKLVTTVELDPKGNKITCPAFGLYSSPAEYSTMGHIVLDMTNLAYQPTTKWREQPGHPTVESAQERGSCWGCRSRGDGIKHGTHVQAD